jgi:Pro-kumamolisin, activation domain/Bacterial Ig-like domain (group 3)
MFALPRFLSSATHSVFIFRHQRIWNLGFGGSVAALAAVLCIAPWASAQTAANSDVSGPRSLITIPVDDAQRTTLRGNTHPLVRRALDQGAAPSSLPMQRMVLVLKRSAEQESALRALLDIQQVKGSPNYHQWLTPQQFGKQFGPADSDIAAVEAWLESHGFKVDSVSNGRTAIEFSGTAGQVQEAFQTKIHSYLLNGEQHWANSSDPSIPSGLAPVVKGVLSLHNFPRHALFTARNMQAQSATPTFGPLFTYASGTNILYGVGPTDWATIYNVLPLWNAGITGAGETIAIVGETDINLSDIASFRSLFGLPANTPNIIVNGPDPGISPADEPEAVLDVSWSGAVAKNATIDLVSSATTSTALGVDLSALYIVDNDLAPIMSESYGVCESALGDAGNQFYNLLWQQAAAEGITVSIAAGDSGSAGCDNFDTQSTAQDGLAVSGTASTPYNVAVGGTDFDQTAATAPNYWSATNNSTTGASALGYIPETTWNQSCAGEGVSGGVTPCTSNGSDLNIVAGSGGPSNCSSVNSDGTCAAGYAKPAWQSGAGVPQDGVRDIPDISLFASGGFNNSFYIMCEADLTPFGVKLGDDIPCSLANLTFVGIGGTSAAAPTFAGVMALIDQQTGVRQGNANYVLYNLAAQPGASCNSSTAPASGGSCIFYDITKGNDSVPCTGTLNCGFGMTASQGVGIMVDPNSPTVPAWTATTGYDLATGLGSLNAANLVKAWSNVSFSPSATTLVSVSPQNLVHGQPVSVSVAVAAKNGSGTPTGAVALMAAPNGTSTAVTNFALVNGAATGTTTLLPGGAYNVTAHYAGDGSYGASDSAPVAVTVGKENSQTTLTLEAYSPPTQTFSPANSVAYGSIFFLHAAVSDAEDMPCAPSPQQSQVACPTGTISFTEDGKPLDAGTYPMNTLGFAEDQTLYGDISATGSYTIQGQYSGDTSYNSGNPATINLVVTPAPTQMSTLEIPDAAEQFGYGSPFYSIDSGQAFNVETAVSAYSVRSAPTGPITFLENGAAASGTVAYYSLNGTVALNGAWTYLNGQLPVTINTPGTYIFSASYPGDGNYAAAQTPYSITVVVSDQTFQITPPIANVTVTAGQSGMTNVTLAAVDNFGGVVNVTCTLPAGMAEATCPASSAVLGNITIATAPLTITTTAPHTVTSSAAESRGPYGIAVLASLFLLTPIKFRRKIPLAMLFVVLAVGFNGCGGISQTKTQQDPGTPPGTYTVTVTASSNDITRTGTFTVTVE